MVENIRYHSEAHKPIDSLEISKRESNFNRMLRRLTPEQRDMVTELTSVLMEPDIYGQYKGNKDRITDLSTGLRLIGLSSRKRRTVLKYLNLS